MVIKPFCVNSFSCNVNCDMPHSLKIKYKYIIFKKCFTLAKGKFIVDLRENLQFDCNFNLI